MIANNLQTGQCHDNEVYYKLYQSSRTDLLTVVCMQWFDEPDYDSKRFVRNENGDPYYFEDEDQAIAQLNEWFQPHQIDPMYRNKNIDLIR
jgi:hypothetical protein